MDLFQVLEEITELLHFNEPIVENRICLQSPEVPLTVVEDITPLKLIPFKKLSGINFIKINKFFIIN
jgi:hypothetical protein